MVDNPIFMIAGITRTVPEHGECFSMLTVDPGPDIAPYHPRQIVVLGRDDWTRWLDPKVPPADVLRPAPAGTMTVTQVR